MVQPLSSVAPVTRPEWLSGAQSKGALSNGKYDVFKQLLRGRSEELIDPKAAGQTLADQSRCDPPGAYQIVAKEEHQGGLAPEVEASLGGRGLDLAEWLALVQPMSGDAITATPVAPAALPGSPAELTTLVERWVKRVALGGDQRRGVARLDIGQGRFAGTELLVVADGGQVSVELSLPADASVPGLAERLRARLERRGLSAEVTVR